MRYIEVEIDNSQTDDLNYVHDKFLEACVNTLKQIADQTNDDFIKLIHEFLPDLQMKDDTFLKKWNLSKNQIISLLPSCSDKIIVDVVKDSIEANEKTYIKKEELKNLQIKKKLKIVKKKRTI